MQSLQLIRYFFYIAGNWNFRIALHILRNEIKGEKKYGVKTTGADELQNLQRMGIDISHATIYMPASYDVLENVFTKYKPATFNHFVDIGCGKGRVLSVAASLGAKKVTGIDLSKKFCEEAKKNLALIQKNKTALNYKVYNNDAFYFDIDADADCIFLFNPFDDTIMSGVIENIEISLEQHPRKIIIIYVNPLEKHLFTENNYKQVYHFQKMHYLEVSVFEKDNFSFAKR